MKRRHDGHIVTQVQNLLAQQRERPMIDENDPFVTEESCLKYSSMFSKHADKVPEYMVENNDLLDELTSFSPEFWKGINKLQLEREEKRNAQEKEKQRLAEIEKKQELQMGKLLDEQVDKIFHTWYPLYKRDCPIKYPRKTYITRSDHEAYLRAFIKFQIRPPRTKIEQAELEYFQALQSQVCSEQQELMEFAEQVFRLQLPQINHISPIIEDYLTQYIQFHLSRVSAYPNAYTMEMKIPIKSPIIENILELKHVGHLLSLGEVPMIHLPTKRNIVLSVDRKVGQNELKEKKSLKSDDLFKKQVSEDPNASFLAKKWSAKVVISASAFKTLVNNQDSFVKEWDIPVTIRFETVKDEDGEETLHKVIYVDKELVRKSWLPLEKKKLFYKKSAKDQLFRPRKNAGTYKLQTPHQKWLMEREKDEDPFEIPDPPEFGTPFETPKPLRPSSTNKNPRSRPRNHGPYNRQDLDNPDRLESDIFTPGKSEPESEKPERRLSGSYLDELLDGQSSLLTSRPLSPMREHTINSNIKSYLKQESSWTWLPWANTLDTEWEDYEPKNAPSIHGFNYNYQLYNLEHKEDDEKNISMIVRHKVHGMSRRSTDPTRPRVRPYGAYVVDAKVENQAYFGCEINKYSEILDQWATLAVRPNTTLLHLRACTETGTVMVSESRSMDDVIREGKQLHIQFDPKVVVNSLFTTFDMLGRMPAGQYILHHTIDSGSFYEVLKSDPTENVSRLYYDLHKSYAPNNVVSRSYAEAPFLPIDTHVLTPFHIVHRKIPATFPMHFDKKQLTKQQREYYKNKNKKTLPGS